MAPLSFLNKPVIKVTLEQEMVFLRPVVSESPSEDSAVRGTVMLSLPKPKAVKAVAIWLEALSDVYGGIDFPYESERLMQKTLDLDLGGEVLEAGDHAFRFNFLLPSTSAVFQRCSYGRTRHFVRASVQLAGPLNLKTSSNPIAVWVSANPAPPGEPPEPLDSSLQHLSSDLGPISISLSSPHLTVASLVHAELDFLSPPLDVTLINISLMIAQTFVIYYKDPGRVARPAPRRHLLQKVDVSALASPLVPTASRPVGMVGGGAPQDPIREDPSPLHQLRHEEEYRYTCLGRVPSDDVIRPSTLAATEAKINVTHKLVLEVRYSIEGEEADRLLSIARPVTIASCCCLAESLLLPSYTPLAPSTPIISPLRNRCLCNTSLEEMRTMEGLALERASTIAGGGDSAAEVAALRRAEREIEEQRRRSETKSAPGHLTAIHALG